MTKHAAKRTMTDAAAAKKVSDFKADVFKTVAMRGSRRESPSMLAALFMVRNEEESIAVSIKSVAAYVDYIVILDTGSTDRTIEIIRKTVDVGKYPCKLIIESTVFQNFPITRNACIQLAEDRTFATYLILMDAGDEFQTQYNPLQFRSIFVNGSIPPNVNLIDIEKIWKETHGPNGDEHLTHHRDVRFIRSNVSCRYNPIYPVHETFLDRTINNSMSINGLFTLYQDRDKYGGSTDSRISRDIRMLTDSCKNRRNLNFLGQSYLAKSESIKNPEDKFYIKLLEKSYESYSLALTYPKDNDSTHDYELHGACMSIAIKLNLDLSVIKKHLTTSIAEASTFIDPYIFFFQYATDILQNSKNETLTHEITQICRVIYPLLRVCEMENSPTGRIKSYFYLVAKPTFIDTYGKFLNIYTDHVGNTAI